MKKKFNLRKWIKEQRTRNQTTDRFLSTSDDISKIPGGETEPQAKVSPGDIGTNIGLDNPNLQFSNPNNPPSPSGNTQGSNRWTEMGFNNDSDEAEELPW